MYVILYCSKWLTSVLRSRQQQRLCLVSRGVSFILSLSDIVLDLPNLGVTPVLDRRSESKRTAHDDSKVAAFEQTRLRVNRLAWRYHTGGVCLLRPD